MHRIAIFASGEGTNAEAIIRYFQSRYSDTVFSIWTNRVEAGVLKRAETLKVPSFLFTNEALQGSVFIEKVKVWNPDLIILAGFLRKIPDSLIKNFVGRVINIHPSLLPKFGGKGMHGMNVHEAVKDARETQTGITIHLVNEEYDKGEILYQHSITIYPYQSAQEIGDEVRKLEVAWYPLIIENYLQRITGAQ